MAYLKRFALHLVAAIGATGVFVAAAVVGASQTRQQEPAAVFVPAVGTTRTPIARGKPTVVVEPTPASTPTPAAPRIEPTPASTAPGPAPATQERPTAAQPQPTQPVAVPRATPAAQVPTAPAQPPAQTRPPAQTKPQPTPVQPQQPQPVEAPPADVVQAPPDQPAPTTPPQQANPPQPRATPTHAQATPKVQPAPTAAKPAAERSLTGTVKAVLAGAVEVVGTGGREWKVAPASGALIKLNGKPAHLDALQPGDAVVILGQAQAGQGQAGHFVAHAITARRK